MSKVDAMQAMREARYAARAANKAVSPPKPASVIPRKKVSEVTVPSSIGATSVDAVDPVPEGSAPPALPETAAAPAAPVEEALCGHRSMNNRICRRPAGHSEKNHRYQ